MATYGEALSVKALSGTLTEKLKEATFSSSKMYQLIDTFDDLTVVWSSEGSCLYTQIQNASATLLNCVPLVQTISISKPPIWEVQKISINKSGTGVLIWGSHGIAVISLPKRWGNPCLFEGGAKSMTCRIVYIGDNLFTSFTKLSVLSASWHPGCLSCNHVAVLSNDNCFRIYNLNNVNVAETTLAVGKPALLNKDRSTLNCDMVTGELAVDFDFGVAILPDNYAISKSSKDDPEEMRRKYLEMQWPVFILYSNGDVYYIVISLSASRCDQRTLYGPMVMLPAVFDNYGLDYCSLIVLPCSPQVLVIANTSANIHHCIVLEKSPPQLDKSQSMEFITKGMKDLKLKQPNFVLQVYESIKLDLSFIADAQNRSSDITLIPDPHIPSRYWISHLEGVHGVSFPLVDRLVHMEEKNFELELWNDDVSSSVEHFLCTKPVSSMKTLPVIGLAVKSTPPSVYVLLASGLIYTFPIPNCFAPFSAPAYQESTSVTNQSKNTTDAFSKHIRNLLHRLTSQPLLISGSIPDIESDEYLLMVASVVRSLGQNYLQPQVQAREEIFRRVNILLEQKKSLLCEVESIIDQKKSVTDVAHAIAEKYEEANEKHSSLLLRLEKLMSRIVSALPTLCSSERAMVNELTAIKERSQMFEKEISQLTAKHQWQTDEIKKQRDAAAKQRTTLSEREASSLQSSLNAESRRLKLMTKKLMQLKSEADI